MTNDTPINVLSTSDRRLERLRNGTWLLPNLQEAMREIDQMRVNLQRLGHSPGIQALGVNILSQFLADLDEAFIDLAEVSAEKYRSGR